MQKYFFDISDGVDIRDDIGQDLPDLETARHRAIARATTFVSKLDNEGLGGYIVVTIRDASAVRLTLRLVCQMEPSEMTAGSASDLAA